VYPSVEHYYTREKALYAGRDDIADKILQEPDPVNVKRYYGNKIEVNHKVWTDKEGKDAMRTGIKEKFTQNTHFLEILKDTRGSTLVECNQNDSFWGISIYLNSKEASDCTSWKGLNMLGTMLSELRDSLL